MLQSSSHNELGDPEAKRVLAEDEAIAFCRETLVDLNCWATAAGRLSVYTTRLNEIHTQGAKETSVRDHWRRQLHPQHGAGRAAQRLLFSNFSWRCPSHKISASGWTACETRIDAVCDRSPCGSRRALFAFICLSTSDDGDPGAA